MSAGGCGARGGRAHPAQVGEARVRPRLHAVQVVRVARQRAEQHGRLERRLRGVLARVARVEAEAGGREQLLELDPRAAWLGFGLGLGLGTG